MRKFCFILACAVAVLFPSRANASELLYQHMGLHDIVTIGGTSGVTGSYYAGEIDWKWNGAAPEGFAENLATYCVDIFHEVASPQSVEIGTTAGMSTSVPGAGGQVAWLLNSFGWQVVNGVEAAALQVAIWETLYDSTHNLGNGQFALVTSDAAYTGAAKALAIATQADWYLTQLDNGDNTSTATWLHAVAPTGGQDQITTPEPASLMLLGVGGVVARLYRRRRPVAVTVA